MEVTEGGQKTPAWAPSAGALYRPAFCPGAASNALPTELFSCELPGSVTRVLRPSVAIYKSVVGSRGINTILRPRNWLAPLFLNGTPSLLVLFEKAVPQKPLGRGLFLGPPAAMAKTTISDKALST